METFPSILPNCTNALSGTIDPRLRVTEMDDGYVRQEQRFTGAFGKRAVSWMFSGSEYEIFQAWVRYKISNGADWFLIDLPNGASLETTKARFEKGQYKESQVPVLYWRVNATLEFEVTPTLTEDELDALLP